MKPISAFLVGMILLSRSASAQVDVPVATSSPAGVSVESVQQVGPPGNGVYSITEAGPHHRRWAKVSQVQTGKDSWQALTNSYVELATGMNVWSATDHKWIPASDEIELFNGAAVARKAQHRVIFSANLNDQNGTIDMLTPANRRIRCRIAGLAYTDATGKSVFIAQIKDSQGIVMGERQVIYADSFDSVKADVRYSMSLGAFEQDVILREQLPDPAEYGLKPEITHAEVWTEFLEAPEPIRIPQVIRTSRDKWQADELLEFGSLRIVLSKAYSLGEERIEDSADLPITKEWQNVEGRQFLIEAIDYSCIEPRMRDLARHRLDSGRLTLKKSLLAQTILSTRRSLPLGYTSANTRVPVRPVQMAKAGFPASAGLVLDFRAVNGTYTNFTFQSDSTYYISGMVTLMQNTVLEGGAVIKSTNYIEGSTYPVVIVCGPFSCQTSMFREATFTSKDDESIGESIPGSTTIPDGRYGWLHLYNNGSSNLVQYTCFRSGGAVVAFTQGIGHEIRHVQIVNCYVGIAPNYCTLAVRNSLITGSGFAAFDVYSSTMSGEHLTIAGCNRVFDNSSSSLALTNSLLIAFNGSHSFTGFSNATNSSAAGLFQPVGAGNFYLAPGSAYRDVGTTNINAQLNADLRKMTTFPPIVLTNDFTAPTTLAPQAKRDTDALDLGYHYQPLDFCISNLAITNTTLTLTNGVILGYYAPATALILKDGAKVMSQGKPTALNWLVPALSVQEQPRVDWRPVGAVVREDQTSSTVPKELQLSYTAFAGQVYLVWLGTKMASVSVRDCQFYGGGFWLDNSSTTGWPMRIQNSLFERMIVRLLPGVNSPVLTLQNNLLRLTWMSLNAPANNAWKITDNLFESVDLTQTGTTTNSNNAYYLSLGLAGSRGGDVTLAGAPDYLPGPLGNLYYPTTGTRLASLINVGSRSVVDAGLYHHTVRLDQVKDTSTVDIGFHYVALDGNSNPNDYDADGIPDYVEDRNGNGAFDPGFEETDWQWSNSSVAASAGLQVFTPLR